MVVWLGGCFFFFLNLIQSNVSFLLSLLHASVQAHHIIHETHIWNVENNSLYQITNY